MREGDGNVSQHLLLQADARRIPLADGSIHCCTTSPPYFGLRNYGVDRQIGLEASPDDYVAAMVDVFREVRRVLHETGVAWLNLGDSYSATRWSTSPATGIVRPHNHCRDNVAHPKGSGLPDKNLLGIPWRVALALRADGWWLRSAPPWIKCLSGGTRVYARTQKGDMPMTVKDLVRLRPETVKLWNGSRWTQVVGFQKSDTDLSGRKAASNARRQARYAGKEAAIEGPIELVLRSGQAIGCTKEHVWPTQRGNVRSDEIRIGDVIATCRLPEPDSPRMPAALGDAEVGWFVGLYIAEGSRSGETIQISSHAKELERFARLEAIARAFDGTFRLHVQGENKCTACLDGRMLGAIIDTYVSGRIASDKHLGVKCWQRSDAFLSAVLQGYLSGDGHHDTENDRWRLGFCNNDGLASDLRTLCARLGISLRLNRCQHQMGDRKFPGYRGQIRFTRSDHNANREDAEVVEIRASLARCYWDIAVEDDPHLFALASGVLTHNSNPMPESVTDRPGTSHEYVFLLSKSADYFYDADAVRKAALQPPGIAVTAGRQAKQEALGRQVTGTIGTNYGASTRNRRTGDWTFESIEHAIACHRERADYLASMLDSGGMLVDEDGMPAAFLVNPRAYAGAHFAVWPEALVSPMIRAGTSERGCCPACRSPWVRVVEKDRVPTRPGIRSKVYDAPPVAEGSPYRDHNGDICGNRDPLRHVTESRTVGWEPSCRCDAGEPQPCRVLDVFGGSMTTVSVATGLGRVGIGMDLSAEYLALGKQRVERPHARVRRATSVPEHLPLFSEPEAESTEMTP